MTTRILVIGGGASGVLLAAHLLRSARAPLVVTIVEQREELGAGIAYATKDPDHLLNVRAANMSAFSDEPEHFFRWLNEQGEWQGPEPPEATSFAPRRLYRRYLESLLAPHFVEGRLRLVRAQAVAATETSRSVTVTFSDRTSALAEHVVLATGNEGPKLPQAPWRFDGWTSSAVPDLPRDAPIVIVGTGLTMVDWVLTLLHGGHRGPITAVSHRGLMPQEHRAIGPHQIPASSVPFAATLSQTMNWLRAEARGVEHANGDWRSAIDAVRPYTQDIWRALPLHEKRRFLRHARPWWDQHRHRVAPDAGAKLRAARERGQFRLVAARVVGFDDRGPGVDVTLLPRGKRDRQTLFARAVFECRGRAGDIGKTDNPMLRSLLDSGQARPDSLQLGLDVAPDLALIGRNGTPSRRLHALGPVTSGIFWEVTAVPDIRVQAAKLAGTLLAIGG